MIELFVNPESARRTSPCNDENEKEVNADLLFVPENCPPLPPPQQQQQQQQQQAKAAKKRVTFKEPVPALPAFLTAASRLKNIPRPPGLARTEIEALRSEVGALGEQHLKEMRAIDRDYERFWERKLGCIRRVVEEDGDE